MAKRYTRVDWKDKPNVATPISAANLNKMDKGIDDIDNAVEDIRSQLAETSNYANPKLANINERNSGDAVISFIDDDAQKETYTRLLPLFKSKQVPFGSAVITGYIGNHANYMTLNQLQECHENGMETLSHTVDVTTNLTDGYSEEEIDYQLRESQRWLKNNGFEHEGFVYPQNGQNLAIRKNTRYYYDYAFGDSGFNDKGYLDHSRIKRIAFGSWTGGNPSINGITGKDTLEYYKACVDYAVSTKSWLVFMLHVKQQTLEQDTILGQLIDYIKSLNVKVLKPSEAFKIKANKLAVGDLEEKHIIIGEKDIKTNITAYITESLNGRTNASPITEFKKGFVTISDVGNADNASFPASSGTIETYRTALNWEGYSYQLFRPLASSNQKTFKRIWNPTTNGWNEWVWLEDESNPIKTLLPNSVNATTPDSAFENNKISYCLIQSASASGFPKNSAGVLVVDKTVTLNGFRKHRYHLYNSYEIWERLVKSDGTYGEWICLNPYNRVMINVPEVVVPANSTSEVMVNFSGLSANTSHIWGNPAWGLSSGVTYNIMVSEHGKVTIRFANVTDSDITITARNWHFSYIL